MLPSAAIRLSCDVRHFQNNLDSEMAVRNLRLLVAMRWLSELIKCNLRDPTHFIGVQVSK